MSTTPSIVFPTRGLADKGFRYRRSENTNIAKTFDRVRAERAKALRDTVTGQQHLELVPSPAPLRGVQ